MRKLFYMTALVLFLSFLGPIFSDDLIGFHSVSAVDFELNLPDLGLWEQERTDGGYYTIVDDKNNILDKTCRNVFVGDEFIAGNNRHYRVNKVIEDLAYASLLAEDALFNIRNETNTDVVPVLKGKINNLIALYHTHTGESYVPSDGSESLPGKGGIYKVGEKIKEKLQEKNIIVKYDKTPHDPHDADAYRRSRRTAVELMKNNPAAIIDVHRDGVPDPDFYFTNISGMDVTKIRFVVGRQNQNMQSNLEFAKHLKSQLDEFYPGLVHGIFMAKGNYNQDLSPRSLLIEVGTHTNDRENAERGAMLFADGLPAVLGITGQKSVGQSAKTSVGMGDNKSIWWIIGLVVVAVLAFLLLSTGSIKGSISKLKQFSSKEWSNYLGASKQGAEEKEDIKSKKTRQD